MDEHRRRLIQSQDPSTYSQLSEYPTKPDSDDPHDKMLQFLCTVGQLKTMDRTGWILSGRDIAKPEPIAGHMYRMAINAMILRDADEEEEDKEVEEEAKVPNGTMTNGEIDDEKPDKEKQKKAAGLDFSKMVDMCLIHDIAECIVGDITPFDGIAEDEKHRREMNAMKFLVSRLPHRPSRRLLSLYEEYERRESPESKVVKELDRFDVMLQAFQYERSEWIAAKRVIRFDEFFVSAQKYIHHERLREMVDRVMKERESFWTDVIQKEAPDAPVNGGIPTADTAKEN